MIKKIQQHSTAFRWACRLVWDAGRGWSVAMAVLLLTRSALTIASLYLMKLIVDAVAQGLSGVDRNGAWTHAAFLIGSTFAVNVGLGLCQSLSAFIREVQAQSVTDHLNDRIHAKSIEVDLEYYETPQYYDTLHRAQQEAPSRPNRIVSDLTQIGLSGMSLVGIGALLLSVHWPITFALIAAAVPGVFLRIRHAEYLFAWNRERTVTERQSRYFGWMLTFEEYAKEIRLFGLGPLFIRRFQEMRRKLREQKIRLAARHSATEFAMETVATLAMFGGYGFFAYEAIQARITLGDLVMYFQAFQRGQTFLREVSTGLSGLYEDTLFLSNLTEFLDIQPRITAPSKPSDLPHRLQTGIAFEQVSFAYSNGRHVLDNVSFQVRPGEIVALVGENGAGKTTLIKLLCRLYDPTEGRITIDGIDLRSVDPQALRREISVVFQDFAKYHSTVRENIGFGHPEQIHDMDQIAAAARSAGADRIVEKLPLGYETVLGRWFQDGEELSIGEWQKIALARALMRDSQIIVLDEPTSAMDARSEYELFKRMRRVAGGRSIILITHRLSTVQMADSIYVLQGGRILEGGSHNELIHNDGAYARMFATQASYFR